MGTKLSKAQKDDCPSVNGQYWNHTKVCTGKAGRHRKKPQEVSHPTGEALAYLIRHCFPDFWKYLAAIEEVRDPDRIRYPLKQVLCLVVLMFACRISSRRQLDRISDNSYFLENLRRFSGIDTDTVMVSEQMVNVLKNLDIGDLAAVQPALIKSLIKAKRLQDSYVLGYLAICSDGTGIFSSSKPHCDCCLTRKHRDGRVTYMHHMLEAKVLCANGMALSVMSEPIQNTDRGFYDKQDCETKAFKRLIHRIKDVFPRQRFVHLLDSLYAQSPTFELLLQEKQQFICCFKRGSIPTLYDEALELLALHTENKLEVSTKLKDKGEVHQSFYWLDNLQYKGRVLGFVLCEEVDKEGKVTTYTWLTSFTVTRKNVLEIAGAGRMRWKIENEGFNEQKIGYQMEHFCNCNDINAMYCLYLILQIAHMFMQLLAKSNLLDESSRVLKHIAYLLLESLRNQLISEMAIYRIRPPSQIRFTKADP